MNRRCARMAFVASLVVLPALLLVLGGCSGKPGKPAARRLAPVDSSFTALVLQPRRSPLDVSVGSGRATYGRYCAVCHGETGGGDGFNAYNIKAAFDVTPAAFADSAFMATLKDSVALAAIRGGGPAVGKSPAMPPWGRTLGESEIADVWHYARTLAMAAHE